MDVIVPGLVMMRNIVLVSMTGVLGIYALSARGDLGGEESEGLKIVLNIVPIVTIW